MSLYVVACAFEEAIVRLGIILKVPPPAGPNPVGLQVNSQVAVFNDTEKFDKGSGQGGFCAFTLPKKVMEMKNIILMLRTIFSLSL